MKIELERLRNRLREVDGGEVPQRNLAEDKKALVEMAHRVQDLENENNEIRAQLLEARAAAGGRGGFGADDNELARENDRLRREVEMLRSEVETKEAIIRSLDNNSGQNNMNMQAIENLREANERLIRRMADMQKHLNSSGGYDDTMNGGGGGFGDSGAFGSQLY